ncbi:MAG: phospholipase [Myxococcota bacterium]
MSVDSLIDAVARVGPALLGALEALERAARRLDPAALPALRGALGPLRDALEEQAEPLAALRPDPEAESFVAALSSAVERASEALRLFSESSPPDQAVPRVLAAMQAHCRALEQVYPLRRALPPVSRFFLEPGALPRAAELDPDPPAQERCGVMRAPGAPDGRGGFSLYVPESVAAGEARPLVVALHGGSGEGRDFLWSWLREARSRRCLLLAPTSRGSTWSFNGPDVDAGALGSMVDYVAAHWAVDRERVLLTGLSDGATYTLVCGLRPDSPFTALAPLSGVLHPLNFANGNLERARGRRIYLVHGARDWMFPIHVARMAAAELEKAGAELSFREIEDLSHTYAREENARILDWLDPALVLPEVPEAS